MSKNLVFFADGTGNDRAEGFKTNVAKLSDRAQNMRVAVGGPTWQDLSGPMLDAKVDHPDVHQITSYDPGVGTDVGDLIGLATVSGISQNIQDGYDFIVRFLQRRRPRLPVRVQSRRLHGPEFGSPDWLVWRTETARCRWCNGSAPRQ